ncbi:cobalt-precorrin-6A reductase [Actinomadura kijaniata]|uniref:Precorrin-6A/cobalt-precorrin-6A reductase n=1 Tax=Actinomadura namibiensis TaxID=182080 RepID=A0A7W3QRT2_ACTNM|nr:cobalt-precorrin-6A reductase [Actinomadura namibiensis]MBA8957104.1 precorrin-6A/cobalt-precorrin-6A reductase [Actinomadura namibiensis]
MTRRILLLGGTGEARDLAGRLHADPAFDVVSSLAGRTAAPLLPEGRTRVGGFGGPDGLAAWLRAERIDAVVDATHPFAAVMTDSAVRAAERAGLPLLVLRRPGWTERPGDDWRRVPTLAAAAADLPGERVFLTTGRKDLAPFAGDDRRWFLIRSVDPPEPPLPPRHATVLARGPFTLDEERALLREHAVDCLVTKDGGSPMTEAKLTAARELGVPVVMVDRPPLPPGVASVGTVDRALDWLSRHAG